MKSSKITQVCVAVVVVGNMIAPQLASARPEFLDEFIAEYPSVAGTRLESCNVCHTNPPRRNPYGTDFNLAGRQFSAIESVDSDDDGADNLTEIMALNFPGDASDRPGAPATPTATATTPMSTPSPTATNVAGLCDGDCNGDSAVTVDELLVAVNISLGTTAVEGCPAADRNGDGRVTIDELLTAVNRALSGC